MREPISSAGADCGGIAVGIWRRRRGREETERREVRVAAGQAIKFGRPAVSSCSSGFGICWGQTHTVIGEGVGWSSPGHTFFLPFSRIFGAFCAVF